MNVLDWGVLGFAVASTLLGILRGGAKEVLGLGGWLGAVVFAFLGAPLVAPLLSELIVSSTLRWIAASILIFIAVRLTAWFLAQVLAELIKAAKLGVFDKCIGAIYGVFRACVVVLVLAFVSMATKLPHAPVWQSSTIAPHVQALVLHLSIFLPAQLQQWIQP